MIDGIGLAQNMLGLPGLRVLDVGKVTGDWSSRWTRRGPRLSARRVAGGLQAQDRVEVHLRDSHCFSRHLGTIMTPNRSRFESPLKALVHLWDTTSGSGR